MKRLFLFVSVLLLTVACTKESGEKGGEEEGKKEEQTSATDISKVILSEINGAQDFIELYNTGDKKVSLEGAKIRRMRILDGQDDEQTLWEGSKGTTLDAGKYLLLKYEDGKVGPTYLKRDFTGKKNTCIWLQDVAKKKVSEFTRGIKSIGWNQIHMQRCEDANEKTYSYAYVNGSWGYAVPTPGDPNGTKVGAIDQTMMYVVINEIDMKNNKIELFNNSTSEIDLMGFQIRWSRQKGGEGDNKTIWEALTSTKIAPKGFLVIDVEDINMSEYVQKNIHIRLRDASHADFTGAKYAWDEIKRGKKGDGWTLATLTSPIVGSMARIPDGTGDWYLASEPTIGKTNGTVVTGKLVPDLEGY